MAYPPKIKSGGTIPPPEGPPYPSSVLVPIYADCARPADENYQIFGSVEGNNYAKHFVAQWLEVVTHQGTMVTGFGIKIAKRGNPDEPLIIGITQGAPPDDPFNPSEYLEQWVVYPAQLTFAGVWYWIQCYFETPVDVSSVNLMVVAISDTDYDPDTKMGDYLWATCTGVPPNCNAPMEYIPESLGLSLPSAEPCQGPGHAWNCVTEGVDIVQPWPAIYDPNNPDYPVNIVTIDENYYCKVRLHNGSFLCENYTVDFYWDSEQTLFGCYEGNMAGSSNDIDISFTFTMPELSLGYHQMLVKMRQKSTVPAKVITVFVVSEYGWYAASDTASFFTYIAGNPEPCTNPDGAPGDWYCDGTTKMTCTNGSWAPTYNAPECQAIGCINPSGENGATTCFGTTLYKCENGSWVSYIPGAVECAGCVCGNFDDPTSCEGAQGSQGEQCCFWYQKYLWEPARCHSQMGDIMRDYLPFLAVGAGAAILLLALSGSTLRQYIPMQQPTKQNKRGKT